MIWRSRLCWLLVFAALVSLCLFASRSATAQSDKGQSGNTKKADAEETTTAGKSAVKRPKVEPDPAPPKGFFGKIDDGFGVIVGWMAKAFFFPVYATEQQYVQFDEVIYYVRPKGSSQNYKRLEATGLSEEVHKTPKDVARELALGELSKPATGTWNGQAVDYVTEIAKDHKYVLQDDGNYHRQLPMHQKLDSSDAITEEIVKKAAEDGKLKLDDDSNYLLTEQVTTLPLVVLWLSIGAIFFTFYMRGYNIWGFTHALQIVRGKYDNPDEPGEVTHFQALASALSATVGLGNIAGVTLAMTAGGPGAFFWMMVCGTFGMTSKFVECTLGQKYRQVKKDGTVLGGPMQYLHDGLKEYKLGGLGLVLSIAFAVMCILASFGGGNMFQANQSGAAMLTLLQMEDRDQLTQIDNDIKAAAKAGDDTELAKKRQEREQLEKDMESFAKVFLPVYGVILAALVGIVIIGGIKRIGAAAEKVVPTMCAVYMAACLYIIMTHIADVPGLIGLIFTEAFSPKAFGGGLLGVIVIGVRRAAFSNEAGVGSASIAHSAAKTDEPIREGTVALMEPFIDTVVVCSMTALVILITGAWNNEEWIVNQKLEGSAIALNAFKQEISFFPYILTLAVVLFAYSTLISWSYYGERCWERLFGPNSTYAYKVIFVIFVFVGSIVNLGAVLDFSDMMILAMAFPNILGLFIMSSKVRADLTTYWSKLKAGEFEEYH